MAAQRAENASIEEVFIGLLAIAHSSVAIV